jgi:hypothetical protein
MPTYVLALGTAGGFRALVLITNLIMLRGRSQLATLAIIALSILERLQMVGRVLDRKDMDLHVRKIAAVSRKGTYILLEEPAWLSWGNVFSNCTLLLEFKDLLWRFSWWNVDFIMNQMSED